MKTRVLPLLFAAALPAAASAQTSNPFPAPIPAGGLVVQVKTFGVVPQFNGQTPRVQQLLTAPDGRIFVLDQLGAIYVVSANGKSFTRYLDVTAVAGVNLVSSGELGLESMAFHPDFLKVGSPGYGKFYTAHTSSDTAPPADFTPGGGDNSDDNVVLEWRVADPLASRFTAASPGTPFRELLRVEAPFGNHTIGLVAFNPNSIATDPDYGKLYVGLGDGGSGGDPLNLAQNKMKAHGKILRIDPLGTNSTNGKYGIPADNPFVGTSGVLPEIWALGLRNPQRFHWDRGGVKTMFIADIGQGTVEEIDRGVAGANYGWRQREGSFVYNDAGSVGANSRADAGTTGFTYPIAEYDHSEGVSITAGFVYRAEEIPALDGKFLFGDISNGRVFYIDGNTLPDGGQSPIRELGLKFGNVQRSLLQQVRTTQPGAGRVDLRFGTDATGRIFLLNKQDSTIRVLTATPATPIPRVTVAGQNHRTVPNRKYRIHGTASSSVGIREVQVHVVGQPIRRASGTTAWRYLLHRLDQNRRTRVVIRSIDNDGRGSKPRTLYIRVR